MLEKLLDRTHLEKHIKAPYPDVGEGYEMVQANDGSGLLFWRGVNPAAHASVLQMSWSEHWGRPLKGGSPSGDLSSHSQDRSIRMTGRKV